MKPYIVMPEARQDLYDIRDFIAEDSVEAADRVREEFEREFAKLAEMPGMGHLREDLAGPHVRFCSLYSYLIAYRADRRPIEIWAVVHGARNLDAFFARRFGSSN